MTLNPDCVRDVLLAMEQCEFGEYHTIASLHEDLSQYSEEELCYTCLKLSEGNLLSITSLPVQRQLIPGIKSINDLTYEGHLFLANIHKDAVWAHIKGISSKVGAHSLTALTQIAANVVTMLIKQEFGML